MILLNPPAPSSFIHGILDQERQRTTFLLPYLFHHKLSFSGILLYYKIEGKTSREKKDNFAYSIKRDEKRTKRRKNVAAVLLLSAPLHDDGILNASR